MMNRFVRVLAVVAACAALTACTGDDEPNPVESSSAPVSISALTKVKAEALCATAAVADTHMASIVINRAEPATGDGIEVTATVCPRDGQALAGMNVSIEASQGPEVTFGKAQAQRLDVPGSGIILTGTIPTGAVKAANIGAGVFESFRVDGTWGELTSNWAEARVG
jgi:ABC-type glycerol-3-phosphate transport system substrate-binding protein